MKTINKKFSVILMAILAINSLLFSSCEKSDEPEVKNQTEENLPNITGYPIVETNQSDFYNNTTTISEPQKGDDFYGQDANYTGNTPQYIDNGDGTVTDMVTGLMWQQGLFDEKYTYSECLAYAQSSSLAGYTDWRLPTIKELYSLILFTGKTSMVESSSIPYLDTDYFDFRYGSVFNERSIDAQYATSTIYTSTTMNGDETMFGVNFADGRIKGYPTSKDFEIKLVRGRTDYGINDFTDNNDGTITDNATGLMWDATGSTSGMNWEDALKYAQTKNAANYLGYNDWRLPDIKELQSIVDYSKSPDYTNSAAISNLFTVPEIINEAGVADYPWYHSSTTHSDGPAPDKAAYICFGRALGSMDDVNVIDVHGAGCQRSDPKSGSVNDYPNWGDAPQGDVQRVFNYVRLVRSVNK